MDTYSLAKASVALGTSVPRVQRAIEELGLVPTPDGRGRRLSDTQVDALRQRLGYAPQIPGLTREEIFVLAALNRRPLGVRSIRALARAASVSPTTAGRAVANLMTEGLVTERTERLVEGAAIDAPVITVARDAAAWIQIAPAVRKVVLPTRHDPEERPKAIPHRLWHHFWNAEPAQIRLPRDSDYVAARLLRSDDPQALSWAASHLAPTSIRKVAGLRGLDEKQRSLILHLATSSPAHGDDPA